MIEKVTITLPYLLINCGGYGVIYDLQNPFISIPALRYYLVESDIRVMGLYNIFRNR